MGKPAIDAAEAARARELAELQLAETELLRALKGVARLQTALEMEVAHTQDVTLTVVAEATAGPLRPGETESSRRIPLPQGYRLLPRLIAAKGAFEVHPPEQSVQTIFDPTEETSWTWKVTPLTEGSQTITATVDLLGPEGRNRTYARADVSIRVRITLLQRVTRLAQLPSSWVLGLIGTGITAIVARWWRSREKSRQGSAVIKSDDD